jgi:hypothetical protein
MLFISSFILSKCDCLLTIVLSGLMMQEDHERCFRVRVSGDFLAIVIVF